MSNIGMQAAQAGSPEINKAWFFAVLSLAVFSGLSAVFIVPPLLVEIATDFEVSVAVAGQLATVTFAAWAVSLLCVGPLSDSFGRRPVLLTGLVVLCGSVVASAFAPNIETLLALRVLTGMAGGTLPPTAVGVVSDVISPARRARAVTAILGPARGGFGDDHPAGCGDSRPGRLAASLHGFRAVAGAGVTDELDMVSTRHR